MTVNFGSFKEYDMNNRFFNMNLAGGALLDIGVYALSAVRSFMSKQPNEIVSQVKFAPTGSDEQATILLKNEDQQMATIALSITVCFPVTASTIVAFCPRGMIVSFPRLIATMWNGILRPPSS